MQHAARTVSPEFSRGLLAPLIGTLTDALVAGDVREDDTQVGEGALDLMRAACRDRAGLDAAPADARAAQVKRYIDEHIGDPSLSPATVAAANFMSLRTLQRLFRAEGLTVRGWIRQRRLAGARRDLRDPRWADASIAQIAHAWGLPDAAHFSRLFRAAYGASPRDSRGDRPPR
jgi:AraC-like DNA-binding protein